MLLLFPLAKKAITLGLFSTEEEAMKEYEGF